MFYGLFLSFASFAAYSFSDAFVKFIDGTLPPYETAFYGAVFGLVILPFMKAKKDQWSDIFRSKNWPLWFLRNIAMAAAVIGSVTAFTHLSMAEAFSLIFLQPIFVSILSLIFLKEHVGKYRWLAIIIGFIGVIIILRPGFRELNIGHLGAVFAGLGSAISIIVMRVMGNIEKRITLYASGIIGTIIICGILTVPTHIIPNHFQWLYLAGYGLLAAFAAVLTMAAARLLPAAALAAPQYSQMAWAILIGFFIFHEHLDLYMWIGIILIMASSLLTFVREEKRNVTLPRPVPSPAVALAQLRAAHKGPSSSQYHPDKAPSTTKNHKSKTLKTKSQPQKAATKTVKGMSISKSAKMVKDEILAKEQAMKAKTANKVVEEAQAIKAATINKTNGKSVAKSSSKTTENFIAKSTLTAKNTTKTTTAKAMTQKATTTSKTIAGSKTGHKTGKK